MSTKYKGPDPRRRSKEANRPARNPLEFDINTMSIDDVTVQRPIGSPNVTGSSKESEPEPDCFIRPGDIINSRFAPESISDLVYHVFDNVEMRLLEPTYRALVTNYFPQAGSEEIRRLNLVHNISHLMRLMNADSVSLRLMKRVYNTMPAEGKYALMKEHGIRLRQHEKFSYPRADEKDEPVAQLMRVSYAHLLVINQVVLDMKKKSRNVPDRWSAAVRFLDSLYA